MPDQKSIPLFTCELSHPWAQKNPEAINFTTTTDLGSTRQVCLLHETIAGGGSELFKELARQGVKIHPPGERYIKEFFMAWLTQLHNAQASIDSVPFGWWIDKSKRHGFVYGGTIMKDDGTEEPAGFGDTQLRELYQPVGLLPPWVTACKMVTDQKRPELDCIIAAAFAAPLMVVPAEYSALLSVWGDSGAGKSTAVKVAQGVWGHPKKTKEVTMSTARSVVHKMGQIRNLPVFWDEVKNAKAQKQVFDTFFTGSEGVGPGRLTQHIEQRARDDWQNMLIICSNISFVDHIVKEQTTTTAGMYRVFEYHIAGVSPTAPGQIDAMDASRITQELETNYGVMGMAYAKLLASDPKEIDARTLEVCKEFSASVSATKEERFWIAICGTLLAGASYANRLGATLDVPAMTEFLQKAYVKNRDRMVDESREGGTVTHTEEALTAFLKTYVENTLFTDTFPVGKGKPKVVTLLFHPDPHRPRPIHVQWAVGDRVLRISRPKFTDYLQEHNVSPMPIFIGLKDHFKAEFPFSTLGGGTQFRGGHERIIQIPVPGGSVLEDQMYAHTPLADQPVSPPVDLPLTDAT